MEDQTKESKSWISEGIILAAVPAVFYFWCFCYQWAYDDMFDIPRNLVYIDLTNIPLFAVSVIGILFYLLSLGRQFIPQQQTLAHNWAGSWGALFGKYSIFVILAITLQQIEDTYRYVGLILAFAFFDWLFAIADKKSGGSVIDRMKGILYLYPSDVYFSAYNNALGKALFKTIIGLVLGVIIFSALGRADAEKQTEFYTLNQEPSAILISLRDDKAIFVLYDPISKQLLDQVLIVPLSSEKGTLMSKKVIGPLHFDPKKQSSFPWPKDAPQIE